MLFERRKDNPLTFATFAAAAACSFFAAYFNLKNGKEAAR